MEFFTDCSVCGCDNRAIHHGNVCGEYSEKGQCPFLSQGPIVRIGRVMVSIPRHRDRVIVGDLFIYSTVISLCLSFVKGNAYLSRCHLWF